MWEIMKMSSCNDMRELWLSIGISYTYVFLKQFCWSLCNYSKVKLMRSKSEPHCFRCDAQFSEPVLLTVQRACICNMTEDFANSERHFQISVMYCLASWVTNSLSLPAHSQLTHHTAIYLFVFSVYKAFLFMEKKIYIMFV